MKMTSMALPSIFSLFMATSEVAPQSISALTSLPTRWKQVLNRPPEPKASPQPTNCRCMECPQETRDDPGPSRDADLRPPPTTVSRQNGLNSVMSITKRAPDGTIPMRPQPPVSALIFYLCCVHSTACGGAAEAASMVASTAQGGAP